MKTMVTDSAASSPDDRGHSRKSGKPRPAPVGDTREPHRDSIHAPTLEIAGFEEIERPEGFCPLWRSYHCDGGNSRGDFHILAPSDRWQIAIHDFTLVQDALMEFKLPEYLSVAWYDSISGEEFSPYRKLRAKSIWGFYSGEGGWRGLIHGGVPVRSVSVEVMPQMSREYLEQEYGGQFERVRDAFASLNDSDDFPELRAVLSRLWPRPGDEQRSQLYYEGKVFEAMGLIVERTKVRPSQPHRAVSSEDRDRILNVASYMDDHCASTLKLPDLARAACMSPTKFKGCFKAVTGSTVTEYVQSRRISQAEQLLRQPDLSIEQVARTVGYTCASRFAELFRRETGLLPSEYRAGRSEGHAAIPSSASERLARNTQLR